MLKRLASLLKATDSTVGSWEASIGGLVFIVACVPPGVKRMKLCSLVGRVMLSVHVVPTRHEVTLAWNKTEDALVKTG